MEDYLASAADISELSEVFGQHVTAAMIRGYAHRGRIAAHGTRVDWRGREVPTYRIGDVRAALDAARRDPVEARAARKAASCA